MSMKIVVTGDAGLIGSALVGSLLKQGYHVYGIDSKPHDQLGPIEPFRKHRYYKHYTVDTVRDIEKMEEIIYQHDIDIIVHFACTSRVIFGYMDPVATVRTNVLNTTQMLNIARKSPKNVKFIFGSSREVYGEVTKDMETKRYTFNPTNIYGVSKYAAEMMCRLFASNYNMQTMVLRFSNVYGSKFDHADRVIPIFAYNIMNDIPIEIHGGTQNFDPVHIDDTAAFIIKAIEHLGKQDNDKPYFDDFDCVRGQRVSLPELIQIIEKITKKKAKTVKKPARAYDVNNFVGDPKKAEKVLGFKSQIDIETGIKRYLEVLKKET